MKYIIFIMAMCMCLYACQEDEVDTYQGRNGIYFATRTAYGQTEYNNTTRFSFAFAPVPDTVIRISVRGYGETVAYDRKFGVTVTGRNAVEGVNYEVLTDELVFKADSIVAYVPVRIYREGCKDTALYVDLQLESNESFTTDIPFKLSGRDTIDVTHHVLVFTDKLEKPEAWSGLGYWSEAKFYFINQEMGIKAEDWYDSSKEDEMFKKMLGIGTYMVNYLNLYVEKDDYANMPKDPRGPRGYMTFESSSGSKVTIPGTWPDASEIE